MIGNVSVFPPLTEENYITTFPHHVTQTTFAERIKMMAMPDDYYATENFLKAYGNGGGKLDEFMKKEFIKKIDGEYIGNDGSNIEALIKKVTPDAGTEHDALLPLAARNNFASWINGKWVNIMNPKYKQERIVILIKLLTDSAEVIKNIDPKKKHLLKDGWNSKVMAEYADIMRGLMGNIALLCAGGVDQLLQVMELYMNNNMMSLEHGNTIDDIINEFITAHKRGPFEEILRRIMTGFVGDAVFGPHFQSEAYLEVGKKILGIQYDVGDSTPYRDQTYASAQPKILSQMLRHFYFSSAFFYDLAESAINNSRFVTMSGLPQELQSMLKSRAGVDLGSDLNKSNHTFLSKSIIDELHGFAAKIQQKTVAETPLTLDEQALLDNFLTEGKDDEPDGAKANNLIAAITDLRKTNTYIADYYCPSNAAYEYCADRVYDGVVQSMLDNAYVRPVPSSDVSRTLAAFFEVRALETKIIAKKDTQ
jgi:hypothetical protein